MAKMSGKEREEYKKSRTKPSGRQLFERGSSLVEDEKEEEGGEEVDWSLYSREERERQRREEEEREEMERQADALNFDDGDDD